MRKLSLSLLTATVAVSAMLVLPQTQTISAKEETLTDQFQELSRNTNWKQLEQIDLQFEVLSPARNDKSGESLLYVICGDYRRDNQI